MIGTEFLKGQGLGNQLFCYVTSRALAMKNEQEFGTAGQKELAVNIHSKKGMYFMNMELGINIEDLTHYNRYQEKDERLFLRNSRHDLTHGCYISGIDHDMVTLRDNTLLYGNLQDEKYFIEYKKEVKLWLQVKEEYESYEYTKENLCVINMRGGEYSGSRELLLTKKYWINGMKNMRKIRSDMEFVIITDDVKLANSILPDVKAYHFDLAKDYVTIKNATYLLLSNSSFAFFPTFTNEIVKYILAPKYWARHNVSDGYWSSEQNIYTGWNYQDRKGNIFTADACRQELERYKRKSNKYKKVNLKPSVMMQKIGYIKCKYLYYYDWIGVIYRGICKRLKKVWKKLR